ncbi:AAA-like domain-containing protein [Planktothricoides raciborskii]|uniref:AAA-like domain-containing protein n=2 Tax=Planktothricoides raciborskii TaxID=132608 RepID=A0AAU8JLN5_9CYAN|nr:AAA-like domain-containing protein [Planktothricoides raciborskii]MBD2545342.1 AAA-like domain-containing protein [Planktothricoides raciborskii FACHB-1370]MBD2583233.1 AAA-like domain-containing protein [Planktothricoides raciborskii FACHB-1261]
MKNIEELVEFALQLLATKTGVSLSYIQKVILRESLLENKKTYALIAEENNYSESYIKFTVAPKLWQLLSPVIGEKVNKKNVLTLLEQKFTNQNPPPTETITAISATRLTRPCYVLESPEGQVPLASSLYVERSPIEQTCYQEILKPCAFIRIKAPRKMGKTSLIARILDYGSSQNYHTVRFSCYHAGTQVLEKSDRFLRCFCANVTQQLGLESRLNDYWDEDMGALINSTIYFQGYLLKELSNPIVLALDGVDQLLEYPEVASDFFVLLRSWYEETKDTSVWQKLRIVIAHTVEVYIPLPTYRSPFNVGLEIELPTFSPEQVQDLAERHQLQLTNSELEQLMKLTGGFPYLIRLALYHSSRLNISVQMLLQDTTSSSGIYRQHLQSQLWNLQQHPKLADAFQQILTAPIQLEIEVAFNLKSLGLVHVIENKAIVSCDLYRAAREYFREWYAH